MQDIYEKSIAGINFNCEGLNTFPIRSEIKQDIYSYHSSSPSVPMKSIKQTKAIQTENAEIKLPLSTDITTVYTENSKESRK